MSINQFLKEMKPPKKKKGSNAIKQISERAKIIHRNNPQKKWKDCIKIASQEYRSKNKTLRECTPKKKKGNFVTRKKAAIEQKLKDNPELLKLLMAERHPLHRATKKAAENKCKKEQRNRVVKTIMKHTLHEFKPYMGQLWKVKIGSLDITVTNSEYNEIHNFIHS